jgi:hypothetical protein
MAAPFVSQSEITARQPPLGAVWRDPASSCPMMRQQVRELMAQRAIDLIRPKFPKPWIK